MSSVLKGKGGYHKIANGAALETVKAHSEKQELVLFGANFCPFVQRVWILLEYKGIPYQYFEVDPYEKPKELLDINPRGLVPALKIGDQGDCLGESTVIMEYLEELYSPPNIPETDSALHVYPSVLPPIHQPYKRARARLAADFVNRNVIPSFYRYIQAQEESKQAEGVREFLDNLIKFTEETGMDPEGPFWGGKDLGWVDMMIIPWVLRSKNVLKHYRGFEMPVSPDGRYKKWEDAVLSHPAVKATTSNDDLYLDSYERYAKNLPSTSQVANAINAGRGLP